MWYYFIVYIFNFYLRGCIIVTCNSPHEEHKFTYNEILLNLYDHRFVVYITSMIAIILILLVVCYSKYTSDTLKKYFYIYIKIFIWY